MGTRHRQTVIDADGTMRISQYGQWDGYPDAQGASILEYLKTGDLNKYQKELSKINEITDKQSAELDGNANWAIDYPYLSRDCGSKIHKMIEDGTVKFVSLISEEEANKWCEGFYTIDFKANTFKTLWNDKEVVFKLDELPSEEDYLNEFKEDEDE